MELLSNSRDKKAGWRRKRKEQLRLSEGVDLADKDDVTQMCEVKQQENSITWHTCLAWILTSMILEDYDCTQVHPIMHCRHCIIGNQRLGQQSLDFVPGFSKVTDQLSKVALHSHLFRHSNVSVYSQYKQMHNVTSEQDYNHPISSGTWCSDKIHIAMIPSRWLGMGCVYVSWIL